MRAFCWYCTHRWKNGEQLHRLDGDFICGRCYRKAVKAIYVPSSKLRRGPRPVPTELPEWGVEGT